MNLDDELRRALGRESAAPEFTQRLLAKVAEEARSPRSGAFIRRAGVPARWLAAAAAIGVLAIGVPGYYAYQQRALEAERATREAIRALTITSEKLALVQQRLQGSQR